MTAKGGGVRLFGQGADGAAAAGNNTGNQTTITGYDGSLATSTTARTGVYGGGGTGAEDDSGSSAGAGGNGGVRIMWGDIRTFPSTNADEASDLGNTTTY
jgi:hypothetical protein